jgi:NAD(P)-dependent dehydrogenase (short-subunit alcohol dehydrogenase family)
VSQAGIDATVAAIEAEGIGTAVPYLLDASDVPAIKAMFDVIDETYGRLNVLYNHVGSPGPAGLRISEEVWTETIDLNMKSAFFATAYAEPLLRREAGRASIMFTASVSGLVGSLNSPLYSMVKGSLVSFSKALAMSLGPDIRVNVIAPGAVDTPMLPKFFGRDDETLAPERVKAFIETGVPLKRPCQPEEVGELACFLATDASSYITGVTIPIDGGYVAR